MPRLKIKKSAVSAERLQFIEPMYAQSVQELPHGTDWLYEIKLTATDASLAKIRLA